MSVRRENTFRIDYANVPKKPSFDELHDFVANTLELQYEQVVRLQPSRALGCAFVKVVNLELAQKIVSEHDNKHETEVDGKVYKLRITMEDGAVEVKLTDLSEDVSNEQVAEFLSAYGEVLSITEQVWDAKYRFAGLPTGARIVRMMVKRNVESYVTIDGQTTNVTYAGQLQTCRYCSEYIHNGISCVQNKKLLVQKTYANVTKEIGTKSTVPKPRAHQQKPTFAKLFGPKPGETIQPKPNPQTKRASASTPVFVAPKPPTPIPADPTPAVHSLTKANLVEQNASFLPLPPQNLYPATRASTRQTTDGNETDISSASTSSKRRIGRPPGKKLRQTLGDDACEENDILN